jgi:hypothetical protein
MMVARLKLKKTFFHICEPGTSSNNIQQRTVVLLERLRRFDILLKYSIISLDISSIISYNQQVWLDLNGLIWFGFISGFVSGFGFDYLFLHFLHYTKLNSN